MTIEDIARVCHEANRALCIAHGDTSQQRWDNAMPWQRESVINGVEYLIDNPDATPEQSHENWRAARAANGWKAGPNKNIDQKTHPCMVAYEDLPAEQRAKDELFVAVVRALAPLLV